MVKICPQYYPQKESREESREELIKQEEPGETREPGEEESGPKYNNYFEKYPFPLSIFQKYSIEAIVEGHHVLVTAHTGSGKTLPAEFAIKYFVSKGKKVIYTSPIKALSNQKYYDFKEKYPDIQFGLLTGDIKLNPNADVLIIVQLEIVRFLIVVPSNWVEPEITPVGNTPSTSLVIILITDCEKF